MSTKIEWAEDTWEIVRGCTPVSEGCKNCYAARLAKGRLKRFYPEGFGQILELAEALHKPLNWRKPRRIFPCSRSDLFHEQVTWDFIYKAFTIMMMCTRESQRRILHPYASPGSYAHTFMVLTKRPERMVEFAREHNRYQNEAKTLRPWPENVWAGVSVESQDYTHRLDELAKVPAKVRFVSLEPLLGPVNLRPWLTPNPCNCREAMCEHVIAQMPLVDWVIAGGESGKDARPCHPDWPTALRDQCTEAGVPFFWKQWGEWRPLIDEPVQPRKKMQALLGNGQLVSWPDAANRDYRIVVRVGKKAAGARLDGQLIQEYPEFK